MFSGNLPKFSRNLPKCFKKPIEKIAPGADAFVRKAREKHLINKYNLIEAGLNKKL